MATQKTDQLAMDEKVIADSELEAALEDYWQKKIDAGEVNKAKNEASTQVKAMAARLELPDGMAARVGRFRIERKDVGAKKVSFETKPSTRYTFGLAEGAEDHVSSVAEADDAAAAAERKLTSLPGGQASPAVH